MKRRGFFSSIVAAAGAIALPRTAHASTKLIDLGFGVFLDESFAQDQWRGMLRDGDGNMWGWMDWDGYWWCYLTNADGRRLYTAYNGNRFHRPRHESQAPLSRHPDLYSAFDRNYFPIHKKLLKLSGATYDELVAAKKAMATPPVRARVITMEQWDHEVNIAYLYQDRVKEAIKGV